MAKRNGYMRLPTADPFPVTHARLKDVERRRKLPKNLRPGFFYMFGERGKYVAANGESGSEEIELAEIKGERRLRKPKSPKSPKALKPKKAKCKVKCIVEPIQSGDTVQRVSLRYGVSVSEIRKANNLYCDQDFFALTTVKIPVKEHSLLTEPVEVEKRRKAVSSGTDGGTGGSENSDELRLGGPSTYYKSEEEEDSRDADDEKGDSDTPEYRPISIQSALKWKYTKESLLKKFDEELDRVREDTEQKVMNQREVAITLNHPSFYPVMSVPSYDKRLFGNIDWRWITGGGLVAFVLFILLIVVRAIWCYYPWAGSKDEKCTLFPTGR